MMLPFSFFSLGLSPMHRAFRVVWWRINSIQLQLPFSGVYHVVEGSCWYYNCVTVMDNMFLFFIEDEFCLALLNPEELG